MNATICTGSGQMRHCIRRWKKLPMSYATMCVRTAIMDTAHLIRHGLLHNLELILLAICVTKMLDHNNYYRNIKVVFELLISIFFTLRSEHETLRKVPEIKDFYEFFFCIDTIVSTCPQNGNISTQIPLSAWYPCFSI